MRRVLLFACVVAFVCCGPLRAQIQGDVLGVHDMTPLGVSSVKGSLSSSCEYCHAPHSGLGATQKAPMWNQQLSMQTYTTYTSSTAQQVALQPGLGSPSRLCLSCHDGTIAPGQTVAYGKISTTGTMSPASIFGTDLRSSHPFSLKTPLVDSPELNALLFGTPPKTADPAVKLINNTVECTSCHDPHVQRKDVIVADFLVRNSSGGQLCVACHDPNRVVSGKVNYLAGWPVNSHATSADSTTNQPYVGGYGSVAQNACTGCHMPHNALGPPRLLRGKDEQDCIACHNGGSNLSPVPLNVFAEFAKTGHPFASGTNLHDRTESAVLNNNRHATCVDCHNPHASQAIQSYGVPPLVRAPQNGLLGVSAADGVTVLNPAVNQFENCLRCHGGSAGKVLDPKFGYHPIRVVAGGDPLNVVQEFAITSTSSHPVTHDRASALLQPSLRTQMVQLDGVTLGRVVGVRIFCTDCHNSDDNREFGGTGPNGPHGSKWTHILERRYEMSQAVVAGQLITNPYPNPDLTVNGPYALCGKCHDLSQIVANSSFTEHARHINDGFSCSTCHTAHGMGAVTGSISGERLVNFDVNVVAPNGAMPIMYSRATNSCNLTCHQHPHTALGAGPAVTAKPHP